MKWLLFINDLVWLATAIRCATCEHLDEHPVLTGIIMVTTVIYAVDLLTKFRALHWNLKEGLRRYWLDILLLIPFVKLFRGLRIIKVGRLLWMADAACDFTEMLYRAIHAIRTWLHRGGPGDTR